MNELMMVEMFVKQVGVNAKDGHPVVLLKEKDGERVMPIWVGPAEFQAIALALKESAPSRPQTHDLLITAFEAVGCKIMGVEISEISDATFYARLYLSAKGKEQIVLDCRPSDGIALALRHNAPITVAPAVVQTAGYPDEQDKNEQDTEEFKKFVENLKPSDFAARTQSKRLPTDPPAACPEAKDAGDRDTDSAESDIKEDSEVKRDDNHIQE